MSEVKKRRGIKPRTKTLPVETKNNEMMDLEGLGQSFIEEENAVKERHQQKEPQRKIYLGNVTEDDIDLEKGIKPTHTKTEEMVEEIVLKKKEETIPNYYLCTDHATPVDVIGNPITLIVAKDLVQADILLRLELEKNQVYIQQPHTIKSLSIDNGPFCHVLSPIIEEEKNVLLKYSLDDYYKLKGRLVAKNVKQRSLFICLEHGTVSKFPAISICLALDEVEAAYYLDKQLVRMGLKTSQEKTPKFTRFQLVEGTKVLSWGRF